MSNTVKLISAALGGTCVGAGIGYTVAYKKLAAEFEARLENETAEMKQFYTAHKKKHATPQEAVAELIPEEVEAKSEVVAYHKIVKSEKYDPTESEDGAEEVQGPDGTIMLNEVLHSNVLAQPLGEKANPDRPYIISQEEYMQNDPNYEQGTLTYYEKDQVLTDVREDVIDNADDVVGLDSFSQFGHGSSDDNVVHVRNHRLQMDFEIVKSESSYAQDVLGLDEVPAKPRRRGE